MRAAGNAPDAPFKHDPTAAALLTLADGRRSPDEGTRAPSPGDVVER